MPVMDRIVQVYRAHREGGSILPIPAPGIGKIDPPPFYGEYWTGVVFSLDHASRTQAARSQSVQGLKLEAWDIS